MYSMTQWMFFFFFYCIVGWIWESSYCSIREKRLVNRGFMKGPMLPLYGTGAVIMLLVTLPFRNNVVLMFFAGMIGASTMELLTGMAMEALFKVRYWDYTMYKLNIKGYVCLWASLLWGVFTIGLVDFLHRPVEALMWMIPSRVLSLLVMALAIIFVADFATSFRTAMDIRDVLVKLDAMKDELGRYQRRLDVLLAYAGQEATEKKEGTVARFTDMVDSLEARIMAVKDAATSKVSLSDEHREELNEIRIKLGIMKGKLSFLSGWRDFFRREMIRNNPTMASDKYSEMLSELKEMSKFRK